MEDKITVVWEKIARDELDAIIQYIIDQGAFAAAANLDRKIHAVVDKLVLSPYRMFYDKKSGLRKCNVGKYIILFSIIENASPKCVIIKQIIDGRRNLKRWVRR